MDQAASLRKLAQTDVIQELSVNDYMPVLSSPPFTWVDGTFNTRDLGLIPGSPIRAQFVFRSGSLAHVTDQGMKAIEGLGVKRIFDLRSPEERTHAPDPEIPGIENTWIQSAQPESKVDLTKFISGLGEVGYEEMYLEVIDIYQAAWKAILGHVRDRPQEPFMFHCTAGRDRTGVISGLLMALAGASADAISLDYMLSRIGTEPVRQLLLKFAMAGANAQSTEEPGFYNLCQLREESWNAFVQGVQRDYGGFDQFVTNVLGFSQKDLAKIRNNLTET
ncbi:hypothetical protein TruAng_001168 [Truncatella angustata]|nr:hypothetical protein TruAng_001168 [Truncatella angustata]